LIESSIKEDKPKHEKQSRKRVRPAEEQDEAEERRLTALLFGGTYEEEDSRVLESIESNEKEKDEANEISENFFELDRTGDEDVEIDAEKLVTRKDVDSDDDEEGVDNEKPAWVDEDDADVSMNLLSVDRLKKLRKTRSETTPVDGVELERRLRKRFQDSTTARTDWATVDEVKRVDESLLESSAAPLLASSSDRLPPQVLNVVRCPDANQQDPNKAVVQAVHFHPGSDPDRPLMLTAGLDKTLRFFQVDAEESQKIHGIHCTWRAIWFAAQKSSCCALVSPFASLL